MADFLAKIGLDKLDRAIIYGVVLVLVYILIASGFAADRTWFSFFFRWLHVLSGVMWIGILWYFNFVQIPSMPKIPDDQTSSSSDGRSFSYCPFDGLLPLCSSSSHLQKSSF